MRVLFLAACSQRKNLYSNASVRYRCFNPAEDLRQLGVVADVCHVTDFSKVLMAAYDVFVFHRPVNDRFCKKAILALKQCHKTIIADYDDLLFGEENAVFSPMYINKPSARKMVFLANKSYTDALGLFKYITVSTRPLADQVIHYNPEAVCSVVHNGINGRWFDVAAISNITQSQSIGYFAGGACHNRDFSDVSLAIGQVLDQYPEAEFFMPESLAMPEALQCKKFRTFGQKHFLQLPAVVAESSVTIAPLLDNPFNYCKSAIKFLESASVGVSLVATPIPDFDRFQSDGLSFAYTSADWVERIAAYLDSDTKVKTRSVLRECVKAVGMSMQQSKRLLDFFELAASQ